MTKDEALKMALEALECTEHPQDHYEAITAIREALAQPEPWEKFCDSNCVWTDHHPDCKLAQQEPVGLIESLKDAKPCCGEYETCWRACTPRGKFLGQRDTQRTWVGLRDDEIYSVLENLQVMHHRPPTTDSRVIFAQAIEAKLKEKNS